MAVGERVACLSLDMEPDLHCPERRIRLLDDDARIDQLTGLLASKGVPVTVFMVMSHAPRYADRLADFGGKAATEYAIHSFTHDTSNPSSAYEIERACETYGELWNAAPAGYRSPNCLIDDEGIARLIRAGFAYDSSIVPSLRGDRYGYNHLSVSREPFVYSRQDGRLAELPVACLRGIRLPFIFSYVKMFGLGMYRSAMALFPLPDIVVTYLHPYDLYANEIADNIPGWKRYAHRRNGARGMQLLSEVIDLLHAQGYRFVLMRDVAARILRSGGAPVRQLSRQAS